MFESSHSLRHVKKPPAVCTAVATKRLWDHGPKTYDQFTRMIQMKHLKDLSRAWVRGDVNIMQVGRSILVTQTKGDATERIVCILFSRTELDM